MADRTITIRILSGGKPVPTPDADTSSENTPSPNVSAGSENKKKSETGSTKKVLAAYVVGKVWNEVKALSKHYVGKYFDATENYTAQNLVTNASDTIDFGISLFKAGAVGMALGGPIVSKGFNVVREFGDRAINLTNNAYGNYFYGRRAGYVDGGHGTEN